MVSKQLGLVLLLAVLATVLIQDCSGRYLPTRANGERLDKLRELLRELESEIDGSEDIPKWHPESRLFYKREAALPK